VQNQALAALETRAKTVPLAGIMDWRVGDFVKLAKESDRRVIAFTANAVLKGSAQKPLLVMGKGAAAAVLEEFPTANAALACRLPPFPLGLQPDYGCVSAQLQNLEGTPCHVVAVQVKRGWKDDGIFDLTERSLRQFAEMMRLRPDRKAVLNCPLIGNGGFAHQSDRVKSMVEAALQDIDVWVCTL
jgi:hypothetical protein